MYNEENNNRGYLIRKLLITLLLVILIVFLLIWFFPTKNSLKPLYNGIFRDNLNSMQDAADTYFTNERLPKNVGDKVRLTLREMLDKHLLLPFTDKNGQMCDLDASYVEIEKTETEYELKVNLSCDDEEAYVIEHMGCYDKCDGLCNNTTPPTVDETNTLIKEYRFKRSSTKQEKYCTDGYTLGSDGVCYIMKNQTSKHDAVDVKKDVVKETDVIVTNVPKNTYRYLYRKVTTTSETKYSDWTDWSSNKEYDPNNNNITWGKQDTVWNEKNGGQKISTPVKQGVYEWRLNEQIGTVKHAVCDGYYYYVSQDTNKLYQTTGWVYQGQQEFKTIPNDTETTKYVRVGVKPGTCINCTSTDVIYIYKVYTQTVKVETRTKTQLDAVCKVVEKEVPIIGKKYVYVNETVKYNVTYKYFYHTKTRTKETVTKDVTDEQWSMDANDQTLLSQGYKYVKKELVKSENNTIKSCPAGYKLNANQTKCQKTVQEVVGKTCSTQDLKNGYTYDKNANACVKTTKVKELDKDNKHLKTRTRTYEEYKWATTPTLDGWSFTGETRTVNVTNKQKTQK